MRYWLPALATAILIAWLSHQPKAPDIVDSFPDWLGHAAEYGFFALTCYYGLTGGLRAELCTPRRAVGAVIMASLYGVTDEWHQSFVGRDATVLDWLADTVGAALASAVFHVFRGRFARLRG